MANDIGNGGASHFDQGSAEALNTSQFNAALDDAEVLLGYAASSGLLPPGKPGDMVEGIVQARQARLITAQIAIAFWVAYANLSKLTRPVTAASVRACMAASLLREKISAFLLVCFVIVASIILFMNNHTAQDVEDLIEQQNATALKLWSSLQVLESTAAEPPSGASRPSASGPQSLSSATFANQVFADTVEFSRKNQWLLQSASKLHFWFNRWWTDINIKPVVFDDGNPARATHLLVPPQISGVEAIRLEVINQITAYQIIRNYALALDKTDSIIYGGITTYLLPTIYALLGAYLYGFRLYSRLMRHSSYLRSATHSARFFIAAIAGLVVGLFGSLLPKSLALSPLAVAFLVGYAVEAFFSWLDDIIAKLKNAASSNKAAATPEEATGD